MGSTGRKDYNYQDFEEIELLGSGGNADVYKSRITHNGEERTVAIKTPRMSEYDTVDTSFFDEFIQEAELWAQIDDHDNIISVFDWGQDPYPWIALEYMDSGNLATVDGEFSLSERAELFEQICNGVYYAHRHGINHQDLKPANILLSNGTAGSYDAKIGDWGLANMLLEHSQTIDQMSLAYSAPEQVDSTEYGSVNDRTDIYQLGVVAYELFAGQPPFDSDQTANLVNNILNGSPDEPSQVNSEIPSALDDAILQAVAKQKDDRHESVLYLRDAVTEAVADGTATSHGSSAASAQSSTSTTGGVSTTSDTGTTSSDSHTGSGTVSTTASGTADSDPTGADTTTGDKISQARLTETATTTDQSTGGSSTGSSSRSSQRSTGGSTTSSTEYGSGTSSASGSTATGSVGVLQSTWQTFQKSSSDIDFAPRGALGDISFAFQFARTMEWSNLKRGSAAFLLPLLYGLGSPITLGYSLDVIKATAAGKQELPPLEWGRSTVQGIGGLLVVGGSLLIVGFLGAISDSLGGLGALVWLFMLPATLISYALDRSFSSVFSRRTIDIAFNKRYLGLVIGGSLLLIVGYFAVLFSAITVIGIFPVGFLLLTAQAVYIGRRYAVPDSAV